jgi:repressor LexA
MGNSVLTKIQEKALNFIYDHSKKNGAAPTLRELCDYMGYKAVGSAQDLVRALRKKEFLVQPEKQRARALSLTKKALSFFDLPSSQSFDPNAFDINCLGSVPAGNPVEAIEERIGTLRMSMAMFAKPVKDSEKLYAVRAKGLSMVNAGICDGDWLVVESSQDADFGDIVIARLSDDATVKRLMKDSNGWFLQPENDDFSPIYAQDEPFEVVGKVIALQRFL